MSGHTYIHTHGTTTVTLAACMPRVDDACALLIISNKPGTAVQSSGL